MGLVARQGALPRGQAPVVAESHAKALCVPPAPRLPAGNMTSHPPFGDLTDTWDMCTIESNRAGEKLA